MWPWHSAMTEPQTLPLKVRFTLMSPMLVPDFPFRRNATRWQLPFPIYAGAQLTTEPKTPSAPSPRGVLLAHRTGRT